MLLSEQILVSFLFTSFYVVSLLVYRPKNFSELCGSSFAFIFAIGCLFALQEGISQTAYVAICLLWIPLTVDDAINQNVSAKLLYSATAVTVILSVVVQNRSILDVFIVAVSIFCVFCLVKYLESRVNKVLIGDADYYACLAFVSILPVSAIGIWLTIFPLLAILGFFVSYRVSQQIPMLPYMLAGWCLVFTWVNAVGY